MEWPTRSQRRAGDGGPLPLGSMSEQDERRDAGAPDAPLLDQAADGTGDGTGAERVDRALLRLAELDDRPMHEHAAMVEAIHRSLQDILAEDEG